MSRLKDTKILIPEIPTSITDRTRNGHQNIFYDEEQNVIAKLDPPTRGLYAERFDDGWYWICGCHDCLENGKPYSYITCYEHDRCVDCGTHREDLTEIPWGVPEGFQCKPCATKEHEERKQQALENARRNRHSEDDCFMRSEIICPTCASVHDEDIHDGHQHVLTCEVCDTEFRVELEYTVEYTTTHINKNE